MSGNEHQPFATIPCRSCGRAIQSSAARCLWCGIPNLQPGEPFAEPSREGTDRPAQFAVTTVELDYLDGIARLDNPAPVRVIITAAGLEIKEILPGTRTSFIPAQDILGASFTDATVVIEKEKKRSLWGWLTLSSAAARNPSNIAEINHDYILTIRYRVQEEMKTAVFHREDRQGRSYITNVAKIVNLLVKSRAENP